MIVHILHMYNYKNPCTWDESLLYVQHRYNQALHSSTDHSPLQVGLGFQPLGPMDVALPLVVTSIKSSPAPTEAEKATSSLSGSNASANKFRISYRSPMTSTSSTMINIKCHISFKWEKKFGCTCRRNALQDPIRSFFHSFMGHTNSPRPWGIIILNSSFLLSLACIQCSMWISFALISHHYWTPHK
jgi:hypothetical protein